MLQIKGLKKTYQNFTLDCTLQVKPGRITALVGPNGAGKSTMFKAVLGLIPPDGGGITLLGKDLGQFSARDKEQLGVVLSDSGFSGYLTVGDLIPILKSLYRGFDEDLFRHQLQRFGLPAAKQIKDFSTGMKAKLKVLAAISHGAKLLLLDEPTAGLDVVAREELLDLLRSFMEEGEDRAVLISSHISSDLQGLCDDVYMICDGRIVLHQDTDVLLSSYGLLKVSREQYDALDKTYLLRVRREPYGYSCLTDQIRYYQENDPRLVAEKGSIDTVITMMIRGEQV